LARSLNYSINIGAKNLRLKQNKTVAVVVPYDATNRQHVSDPFFLSMLGGLADALTDRGYDMLLSRVDSERLDLAATLYDSGRAMGVIVIGQWGKHDQLNDLASRRVPLAVWGAQMPQQLYCTVGGDNLEGGRAATKHLLAAGRRHVAFLGNRDLPEVAHRFAGYQAALKAARIRYREELYVATPFTANGGLDGIGQLIARGERFDALFCCSDLLAITAINAMRAEGIHVPHDVAVVGYDDVELGQHFHPPLSTVKQSLGTAGAALVEALIDQLEGRKPAPRVLPTTLVVRGTSQ
jgi:DNA-binding LacI/PurR family transcriptional regulator